MGWTSRFTKQDKSCRKLHFAALAALGAFAALQLGCSSSDGDDDGAGASAGAGGSVAGGAGSSAGTTGKAGSGAGGSSGSSAGSSSGGGSGLFTIDASLSSAIETVGIVTWSISTSISEAYIEFGRDQNAF